MLDDIEGLAYFTLTEALYAIHRIPGSEAGTNDVLFQIDPGTGLIKKNAMTDPQTGNGIDYVVIPEIYDGEDFDINLFDVSGITYNPYTNQLYALQTQQGSTILTELNYETGEVETTIFNIATDFMTNNSICIKERNISETLSGFGYIESGTYQASSTINSDGEISTCGKNVVKYQAGVEVNLESGFEVNVGQEFSAEIETCP